MNTQPRIPNGVPEGGRFTAVTRTESGVLLEDPAARPIVLAPGETEDYSELADGQVIQRLEVSRAHVDDGVGYGVHPSTTINLRELVTASDLRTGEAGRDAWFERHEAQVRDFIADRYGADLMDADEDGNTTVEFTASLGDGPATHGTVADTAWEATRIVALHNEYDAGTFGSEYLGRLIRDHVAGSVSVENPYRARGEAMRLTDADIDAMVAARSGEREITDACALAIASRLGEDRTAYPNLHRLGARGYADREGLWDELRDAYRDAPSPTRSARTDMMFTWVLNGGDNS